MAAVPFSEQNHNLSAPLILALYKYIMDDPVIVIAIFLLGASASSLVTRIRFRSELADLKARIDRIQGETQKAA